jgi:hypothetical protein
MSERVHSRRCRCCGHKADGWEDWGFCPECGRKFCDICADQMAPPGNTLCNDCLMDEMYGPEVPA